MLSLLVCHILKLLHRLRYRPFHTSKSNPTLRSKRSYPSRASKSVSRYLSKNERSISNVPMVPHQANMMVKRCLSSDLIIIQQVSSSCCLLIDASAYISNQVQLTHQLQLGDRLKPSSATRRQIQGLMDVSARIKVNGVTNPTGFSPFPSFHQLNEPRRYTHCAEMQLVRLMVESRSQQKENVGSNDRRSF